ncbi:carboxypeptidase-like regulatory domain-containing protein [Corallococcus sp. EGB]|uniref:carboxypeptidase-like regulatory domain-containing protein n=1 Tax=Corallococcus sp. EGB TaxID=1521117 RepID=UPI001CC13817|nr:carboxypeptidase-like regulatory domain-containing protein [Corallococcus sp. EGB]
MSLQDATSADARAARAGTRSTRPLPSPPPGPLRITGAVRDARGPVAGVELSATRVDADSVSQRPCPHPERARPLQTPVEHCFLELAASTARLVEARAGEAPVFARTVTGTDGTFVLEGLPPGAFTLWALGDTGAAVRQEVQAGSEGVTFPLDAGFFLSGAVVEDDGQTPIPGAWVTAVHESASRFFRVLADDKGHFRIGPLPPGRYLKVAGAEGRVPHAFREDVWLSSDVEVTLGIKRRQRLEGVVLTQEGRPASGMTVHLRPNAEFGETLTTRSDARGRFVFDGIPPREYTAWAWNDGQTAYGDSWVTPARSAVIRMRPSPFIEGTVKNEQGRPLSGVLVQDLSGTVGDELPPETVTDEAGHYRLGPLSKTSVTVSLKGDHSRVRREQLLLGGARTGPWDYTLTSGQSVDGTLVDDEGKPVPGVSLSLGRPSASGGFTLAAMNFEDAFGKSDEAGRFVAGALDAGAWDLSVEPQGFIPLTVPVKVPSTGVRLVLDRGASVSGTITDATGQPLPEVRVGLWSSTPSSGRSQPDPISTDSHGAFSMSGLKPGRYVLEAWHRTPGAVQWASQTLDLKERAHADVVLRFEEEGRTLHGVTTDAAGQPLAGVWVQACLSPEDASAGRGRMLSCASTEDDRVRSGPDGRFTLKHLTAPVYQLVAAREGFRLAPGRSRGGTPGPRSMRVPAGADDIRLVMEPSPRLRAQVVDENGAPLPSTVRIEEATFVVACPDPTSVSRAEQHRLDGRFALPLPEDRTWQVTVSAKGFLGLERFVEMSPGQDIDLGTVKLLKGRKVRFDILDEATRAPLAGARVTIDLSYALNVWPYEVAMPPSFHGNLDMTGTVEFEDLPISPIHFKVMTEEGQPYREGIVETRQDVVTVTLPAPGR